MRLPMNPFLKRNEVCVDVPHKPALGMALEIEGETHARQRWAARKHCKCTMGTVSLGQR